MFLSICGAALVVVTCAFYWYLLPRDGTVHPLVRNSDVGSMVTIAIMTMFTFGVAMLLEGLYG
ncbi:MAG: hypothetical protein WBW99_21635 [Pseudolabrys sp.]